MEMTIVVIDGVEYVPKSTVLSDEVNKALVKAYSLAWCNGHYDLIHDCGATEILGQISDLLADVNEEIKFKR